MKLKIPGHKYLLRHLYDSKLFKSGSFSLQAASKTKNEYVRMLKVELVPSIEFEKLWYFNLCVGKGVRKITSIFTLAAPSSGNRKRQTFERLIEIHI